VAECKKLYNHQFALRLTAAITLNFKIFQFDFHRNQKEKSIVYRRLPEIFHICMLKYLAGLELNA